MIPFVRKLQWLLRRRRKEAELLEEIAFHLQEEADERQADGMKELDARWAARRELGNVAHIQEETREAWGWTFLEQLGHDLRYSWRSMAASKSFSALAVLSLALGIGANTAIYSVMDAIMVRALPVRNPDELVILNWRAKQSPKVIYSHTGTSYDDSRGGISSPDFPWPAYELLRDHNTVFSTLFAYQKAGQLNLVVRGQAEIGPVVFVSGNFFSGLGIVPAAGRLIVEDDERASASQVAVLSYNYWQGRFAADPAAVGQTVRINGIPFAVVGVAPPEFFGVAPGSAPVLYIPVTNRPSLARNYGNEHDTMFMDPRFYWAGMMGRLRPGITPARAEAELAARFHQFALASATNEKERATLPALWVESGGSGVDSLRRRYSNPLFILMGMVGLILAIACANIANLLLARAAARRREIAVRLSLGAGRARVLRQLLTESLLMALSGAAVGLLVAAAGIRFLVWLLADGRPDFVLRAGIDWRTLGFTLAVALATGVIFGLAPALEATRVDLTPALKESRGGSSGGHGRRIGLGRFLVVFQIALSLLLVLGAALFVRTLNNLHSVVLGFNPEHLLTFSLDASQAGYQDARLRALYASLEERFRSLPGVRAATATDTLLASGSNHTNSITLPGVSDQGDRERSSTSYAVVGPAFFDTLQIPILLGRPIDSHDIEDAPQAAVVNEVFAGKYFPNQNPIGRQFRLDNSKAGYVTIVGVAKNARYSSLKTAIPPVAYFSYLQDVVKRPPIAMFFELRVAGNTSVLAQAVREVVHDAAPGVPVMSMMMQTQQIDSTISQERTFADLCTAFAVLALAIACVGLFGTVSYDVARRTGEIGIRMALGAQRGAVVWMVLREVMAISVAGIGLSLPAALGATKLLKSFLFGVKPNDPLALALAAAGLAVAALLAGYLPARRASRIDPMKALRQE